MADSSIVSSKRPYVRWLLTGVVVVLVVGGVLYGRALLESRAALREAEQLRLTDVWESIVHYRHAVEWYAPLNPYSAEAVDALWSIARSSPDTDDGNALALAALESLRTALMVTRSFYTPYGDRIDAIEMRIAELRSRQPEQLDASPLTDETQHQLDLLRASRQRAPDSLWSVITVIAFLGWLVLTWQAFKGAFDESGRLQRRRTAVYVALVMVFLCTWIVGLTLV